jgi:hypothetical protein
MRKIEINEFITLQLENNKTNIYVRGEKLMQCKYLLMNIALEDFKEYEEIKSIDEAKKVYDSSLEGKSPEKYDITPEEEFLAHASNLVVWVENDYNPNLLHSNLSVPLLRSLVRAGDKKALVVLKEYLLQRYEENEDLSDLNTFFFLMDYLSEEELDLLVEIKPKIKEILISEVKKNEKLGGKFGDQIAERFGITIISEYGRLRYYGGDPYDNRMRMYRRIYSMLDSLFDSSNTSIDYSGDIVRRVGNYTIKIPITIKNGKYYFKGYVYPSGKYRRFEVIGFDGDIGVGGRRPYCRISHNDYTINDNEIEETDYNFRERLTELIKIGRAHV